jgi:FixJ family two-component response regulator
LVQASHSLIAIVDDEESVRRALGRLLVAAGFDVQTFATAQDFLSSLGRTRPHCVVLDLRMPHMTGFEMQDAMIEERIDVPVVIITGDDSTDARQQTLGRGAKAYLRKPVDEVMLLDAIHSAIHGAAAARG